MDKIDTTTWMIIGLVAFIYFSSGKKDEEPETYTHMPNWPAGSASDQNNFVQYDGPLQDLNAVLSGEKAAFGGRCGTARSPGSRIVSRTDQVGYVPTPIQLNDLAAPASESFMGSCY